MQSNCTLPRLVAKGNTYGLRPIFDQGMATLASHDATRNPNGYTSFFGHAVGQHKWLQSTTTNRKRY